MCLRKHSRPRRKYDASHLNQIPARCIESCAHMRCGNSDVVVELQLADFVLFLVMFEASGESPLIRRLLLHSAALAMCRALLANVHRKAARLHFTLDARQFSYHSQINRVSFSYLFQFYFLCSVEGAFE